MGILANENAISSGGYQISNSLRFQSASTQYLTRTPASAGNRKTWTWSAWVKRGTLGTRGVLFSDTTGTTDNTSGFIGFTSADQFEYSGYFTQFRTSTQVFRDPSAWYHIVVAFDTTNATALNRVRVYVNNTEITVWSTNNAFTLNGDYSINQNTAHQIGAASGGFPFDGYMAEVNFIDGQALTPSSFGSTDPTSGQWVAAKYTGTYGTNGFYLPFSNGTSTTTLGADSSGNSNNWTLTNFTRSAGVSDCWMYDVPSGNGGASGTQPNSNYAVINPLSNAVAPVNANLRMSASTGNYSGLASMTMPSGKWYWECVNTGGSVFPMFGIARASLAANVGFWTSSLGYAYYYDGTKYNASTPTSYGASYTANDIIGVAFDADSGTLTFYKNNVSQGVAFTGLTQGDYCPAIGQGSGVLVTNNANFGQRSFAYTPPTGFKALCTANLPVATIKQGNKYMDATLYTGNGSTQTITNAGSFKPDLVWVKSRSAATDNKLTDSVRGVQKGLISNTTGAETTDTNGLTAFNSNGWSLGTDTVYNANAGTFVGWQWQAGQGSTSSNTNGSITSTTSVNATAGFSVVTWTGTGSAATVGHGLGVAPSMYITKPRGGVSSWRVYHKFANASPASGNLFLNGSNAFYTDSTSWNNTVPTSSVFSLGTSSDTNPSAGTMVAYCFAEIAGFSKFGSYTGNGSADGPFVYLGFRPKFVLYKRTDAAGNDWSILDTSRNPYNLVTNSLQPNLSSAEYTGESVDFVSNGFKIRISNGSWNANGGTYIFAAFAENPFANSNAR